MRNLGKLGVVLFSAAAMMGVTSNVFAANLGDPNDVKKFVKDSDPAIELNENTFLIGEGIFKLVHSDNTVEYVNSKTTKLKVTTVKEARKDAVANNIKKNQASSNSILATMMLGNHPKVAGTNVELQYGQAAGEYMSGSGWRYASYWYYPASGTGDYLWWEARGDSGILPSPWDTSLTPTEGTALYPGSPQYFKGPFSQNKATFASSNPDSGSSYYVLNQ